MRRFEENIGFRGGNVSLPPLKSIENCQQSLPGINELLQSQIHSPSMNMNNSVKFKWKETPRHSPKTSPLRVMPRDEPLFLKFKKSRKMVSREVNNECQFKRFLFKPRRSRKTSGEEYNFHEVFANERFGNAPSYKHTMRVEFEIGSNSEKDCNNRLLNGIDCRKPVEEVEEDAKRVRLFIQEKDDPETAVFLKDEFGRTKINSCSGSRYSLEYGFQIPRNVLSTKNSSKKKVAFQFVVEYKEREVFVSKNFLVFAKLKKKKVNKVVPRFNRQVFERRVEKYFGQNGSSCIFELSSKNIMSRGYSCEVQCKIGEPIDTHNKRLAFVETMKEYLDENFKQYVYILKSKYNIYIDFSEVSVPIMHFSCSDKGHMKNRVNSFERQMSWKVRGEFKFSNKRERVELKKSKSSRKRQKR